MTATAVVQARALIDAARHDDALGCLGPHLATDPADGEALCLAAQALIGLGHNGRASKAARDAVLLRPHDDWPLRLLSLASARMGDSDTAIDAARKAIGIAPRAWQTHFQLAAARHSTNRVTTEAVIAADKARSLAPNVAATHRMAGQLHDATGDRSRARDCFRQALTLDPHDAISRHELARLDLRRGRLSAAAEGFGAAVRLNPRLEVGVSNLSLVLYRMIGVVAVALVLAALIAALVRSILVPVITTALLLAALTWFWRRAGRGVIRYVAGLPRQHPVLASSAALLPVALLFVWVEPLSPTARGAVALMIGADITCMATRWTRRYWLLNHSRGIPIRIVRTPGRRV